MQNCPSLDCASDAGDVLSVDAARFVAIDEFPELRGN
jgi:hypothetical protein